MTCRELAELLIDYLQGELAADMQEEVRGHLSRCPPCEIYVSTYQITIQLSRKLPATPLPPETAARLHAFLQRQQEEQGGK